MKNGKFLAGDLEGANQTVAGNFGYLAKALFELFNCHGLKAMTIQGRGKSYLLIPDFSPMRQLLVNSLWPEARQNEFNLHPWKKEKWFLNNKCRGVASVHIVATDFNPLEKEAVS